jgi:hypothetical protein
MNTDGFHVKADGQVYTCVSRDYSKRHNEVFCVTGAEACKAALRLMGVKVGEVPWIFWTAEYKRGYNVFP